jgi:hypothetical protein
MTRVNPEKVQHHQPKREVDVDRELISTSESVSMAGPHALSMAPRIATKTLSRSTSYPKRAAGKAEQAFKSVYPGVKTIR